jgi:HK97 family phage prohead protease
MPWSVSRSDECPSSRPWACIRDSDGTVEGCHSTEEAAQAQQRALYAREGTMSNGEMQKKTFDLLEVKADEERGTFTALASVFGNVDLGGDKMVKGAFKNTLEKWRKSGRSIPVILSHQWDSLTAYVGKADPRAVYEDDRGLMVQGQLFMDKEAGRDVYRLMKEGLLTGWSFGYKVPAGGQKKNGKVNEVTEVDLFEVGPTLVGMNPEAQLQSVKQAAAEEVEEKVAEKVAERDEALEGLRGDLAKTTEELVALRGEYENLKKAWEEKASEVNRNEEPSRAKSPPDPLKEESRKAILAVMRDGAPPVNVDPSRDPEPKPEPEVDPAALKAESRKAALAVLKGGL